MRTQIRVSSFWWIPVFSRRVVCFRIPVFSPCVIPFFIICRDTSTVFFKMLPQIWDGRSATVIHIWRGKVGYNWITVFLIYWKKRHPKSGSNFTFTRDTSYNSFTRVKFTRKIYAPVEIHPYMPGGLHADLYDILFIIWRDSKSKIESFIQNTECAFSVANGNS